MMHKNELELLFYLWWTVKDGAHYSADPRSIPADFYRVIDFYHHNECYITYREFSDRIRFLLNHGLVSDSPFGFPSRGDFSEWEKKYNHMPTAPISREHGLLGAFAVYVTGPGILTLDELNLKNAFVYSVDTGIVSEMVTVRWKDDAPERTVAISGDSFFMNRAKLQTTPELLANWLEKSYVKDNRIRKMLPRPREYHRGDELWIIYEIHPMADDWIRKYPQEKVPLYLSIGMSLLSENPNLTEVEGHYQTLPSLTEFEPLGQYCLDTIWDGMLKTFPGTTLPADGDAPGWTGGEETAAAPRGMFLEQIWIQKSLSWFEGFLETQELKEGSRNKLNKLNFKLVKKNDVFGEWQAELAGPEIGYVTAQQDGNELLCIRFYDIEPIFPFYELRDGKMRLSSIQNGNMAKVMVSRIKKSLNQRGIRLWDTRPGESNVPGLTGGEESGVNESRDSQSTIPPMLLDRKEMVTTQVTGTFSSKGKFVLGIQVQFTPISAGHLAC